MLIQDVITVSVLTFLVFSAAIFNIMSYTDVVGSVRQRLEMKYGRKIHYDFRHPLFWGESDAIYSVYGFVKPVKPVKHLYRKMKYVHDSISRVLKDFDVSLSVEDFCMFFLKANDNVPAYDFRRYDYYHVDDEGRVVREMFSLEQVIVFVKNDFDAGKVAELYRRGLGFEQVVACYNMPVVWVEKMYDAVDSQKPVFRGMI